MRLIELLFGIRRDLDLDSRWWHRLAKVALFIVLAGVLLLAGAMAYREPELKKDNLTVLGTLKEHIIASKGYPNAVPSFVNAGGRAGFFKGQDFKWRFLLESQAYCGWNISEHPQELAEFLRTNYGSESRDFTVETVRGYLKYTYKDGELDGPNCIDPGNTIPAVDEIVRVDITWAALSRAWARAGTWAAAWTLLTGLILANVYYRGLALIRSRGQLR